LFIEIHVDDRCLELASEIREERPDIVLVGYARHCDRPRRAQAAEAGVSEVLVAPFTMDDLRRALFRAYETRPSEIHSNVLAFLPAKPGSGASLISLNAASALTQLGRKVLLIDGDRANGVLAVYTEANPEHTLDEALETSHELNDGAWEYRRIRVHGFDLLPMSYRPEPRVFAPWTYRRLLRYAHARYDHVLLDLAATGPDGSDAFLKQVRTVWVVVTPDAPAMFLAQRRCEELAALGLGEARIRLLMNRSTEETDAMLDDRIAAVLPDAPAAVREAVQASGLAPANSELGAAFRALARQLAGLPPEEEPGGTGLFSAFRRRVLAHGSRERRAQP
jgi:pilus assembly protein CpaE